jgi:hypothetical protein
MQYEARGTPLFLDEEVHPGHNLYSRGSQALRLWFSTTKTNSGLLAALRRMPASSLRNVD